MNETEISQYITKTFEGVDVVVDSDNSFFFYNPDRSVPPDHKLPFVTIVTNNLYDLFSRLNRPSVFRVNISISKKTFSALFDDSSQSSNADSSESEGESILAYDFSALDRLMPHPVYGRMYWVCVLNPSEEMFATRVRPLLAEAYELAVNRYKRQAARR